MKDLPLKFPFVTGDALLSRERINTMRGMACVLLVWWHTCLQIRDVQGASLGPIDEFNLALSDVRMPLFSFISGLVYSFKPAHVDGRKEFLSRKSARLLVPFFAMTLILWSLKAVLETARKNTTWADLPHMLWYGHSHLWFLQAIFLVFFLMAFVHRETWRTYQVVLFYVGCLILSQTGLESSQALSIGGAVRLLPYFVLGHLVFRLTSDKRTQSRRTYYVFIGSIVVLLVLLSTVSKDFFIYSELIGSSGLLLLFIVMPTMTPLAVIGKSAMAIFLLHGLFISAAERALSGPALWLLAIITMISVTGPMAIEMGLQRFSPRLLWLLGTGKSVDRLANRRGRARLATGPFLFGISRTWARPARADDGIRNTGNTGDRISRGHRG